MKLIYIFLEENYKNIEKGGYSFEQLVEKDLNISATFTDVHTISEFTDSVINEIKNAQSRV